MRNVSTIDVLMTKLSSSKLWMAVVGSVIPLVIQKATHQIGWDRALMTSGVVIGVYSVVQGYADGRHRAQGGDSGPKVASRKLWLTAIGAILPILVQGMTGQVGWEQVMMQIVFVILAGIGGEGIADGAQSQQIVSQVINKVRENSGYNQRGNPPQFASVQEEISDDLLGLDEEITASKEKTTLFEREHESPRTEWGEPVQIRRRPRV